MLCQVISFKAQYWNQNYALPPQKKEPPKGKKKQTKPTTKKINVFQKSEVLPAYTSLYINIDSHIDRWVDRWMDGQMDRQRDKTDDWDMIPVLQTAYTDHTTTPLAEVDLLSY